MPRPDDHNVPAAFAPHLTPGEQLEHYAYGVKQPHLLLIVLLVALGILPGLIAVMMLTRHYLIGLTSRGRFLVLRVKSQGSQAVTEVLEYDVIGLDPARIKASVGSLFTAISIDDPRQPFSAKFHRLGMKSNRRHSSAIAAALTGRPALAAA